MNERRYPTDIEVKIARAREVLRRYDERDTDDVVAGSMYARKLAEVLRDLIGVPHDGGSSRES